MCGLALGAVLAVLIGGAYYEVRRRAAILDQRTGINAIAPVDWPTVRSSPTLWRLAWALSSKPWSGRDLITDGPAPLIGARPHDLRVTLDWPPRPSSDGLHSEFRIVLKNVGDSVIVVPPRHVLEPGFGYLPGWEGGWYEDTFSGVAPAVGVVFEPVLGRGLAFLRPGETIFVTVKISSANNPWAYPPLDSNVPVTLLLYIQMYGCRDEFLIKLPNKEGQPPVYSNWEEVPQELVQHRRTIGAQQ